MQLNQATALLMGIGLANLLVIMVSVMLIVRNQFRYASYDKSRYDNLIKMRMIDIHNQLTSDLSDIFMRYLLLRKGNYHDTGIVVEAMAGTVKGQLEAIMAHFNHELKHFEHYDQLTGIEFTPAVGFVIQDDRVLFNLSRNNGDVITLTLCHPTYFGAMLTAELEQYRTKMRDRIYPRTHRQFESVPQTYLSYAASKLQEKEV